MASFPTGESKRCGSRPGGSISLTVLPGTGGATDKRHIKKSRAGKWRAVVLIGVHVLIAIHLGLWVYSGMRDGVRETLSPVEPSESMYTLENGLVNAGFIFFALALLSTFIFGRFFCGWGCHIVALQDLCGWIMKKCGVHPKPFRSRLLLFVPLVVALYMFVWPTFKREVLFKLVVGGDVPRWQSDWAPYLGGTSHFPGWSNHLIVEDFWQTFAPWYIAIPFIFICTFGVVYFLGNKGFCTYACPYGGFFAPIDRISPGKIKVNDNCEGCGHCTAVCSSNVRVHEEVRDFGMVVDPGCMKCLDCVSVCPNDALSFGFATPTAFTRPRTAEAVERRKKKKVYDLSWRQELLLALIFLGLTLGFRGLFNEVPLLLALGVACIGTFFAWKLIELATKANTRIHGFQLKLKGRLRPAALVFVPLALLVFATAGWGMWVKHIRGKADRIAGTFTIPAEHLLTPGFEADPTSRENAAKALALFRDAGPITKGGIGWSHRPDDLQTIAYLQLVTGDFKATEATLMEIMTRGRPLDPLVLQLGNVLKLQGTSDADIVARYGQILARQPQLAQVRSRVAYHHANLGRPNDAVRLYEDALPLRPGDPVIRRDFAVLLLQLAQTDRGLELLADAAEIARGDRAGMRTREDPATLRQIAHLYVQLGRPEVALTHLEHLAALKGHKRPPDILADLAGVHAVMGNADLAIQTMKQAVEENPGNPALVMGVAQMLHAANRVEEADQWAERARKLQNPN